MTLQIFYSIIECPPIFFDDGCPLSVKFCYEDKPIFITERRSNGFSIISPKRTLIYHTEPSLKPLIFLIKLNGALIIVMTNATITVVTNNGMRYNVATTSANIVPAFGVFAFAPPIQQKTARIVTHANTVMIMMTPFYSHGERFNWLLLFE